VPKHIDYFEPKNYFPNGLLAPSQVRQPVEVRARKFAVTYPARERIEAALELAEIATQYAELLIESLEQTEQELADGTSVQLGTATEGDRA
jgi:hypothetical protein